MKALTLVLVVGLAGCAAQTGLMWGYVAQSQRLSELRAVGYAPDRSECEKWLSRDRHHMTLTNLLGFDFPEACQQFAIADFVKPGPDSNRVYWSPRAGIAFSTPDWCAATQGTTWREGLCRAVVVTPLRQRPFICSYAWVQSSRISPAKSSRRVVVGFGGSALVRVVPFG